MASTNDNLKAILEKLGGEVPDVASNSELIAAIAEVVPEPQQQGGGT